MNKVIDDVIAERERQDAKWGEQNHHPDRWMAILGEEFGELCKEIVEFDSLSDVDSIGLITGDVGRYYEHHSNIDNRLDNMRTEAIHVAAVATQFVECLDRRGHDY